MKNIGIVFFTDPSAGGGFQYESAMLNAILALAEETQEFRCVLLPEDLGKLSPHVTKDQPLSFGGAAVHSLNPSAPTTPTRHGKPAPRAKTNLFQIPVDQALHKHLAKIGVDLLVFLSPSFKGAQSGLPYVMPIWDLTHRHVFPIYYPEVFDNETPSFRDLVYVNACISAKKIIAESDAGKEDILRHYGAFIDESRVAVVDFIPKQAIPRTSTFEFPSENINQAIGRPYFYYPAQFWKHKHHDTLIRALQELDRAFPNDIRLVFSGSTGDYDRQQWHEELLKQAHEAGLSERVLFLGFLPEYDVEFLYRNAIATLMPSAFGPSNLPPLEAIACSCPVAVGDAYGMKRFLPHGVPVLPCADPQPWADFMRRTASEPAYRVSLIESQRANVTERTYARFKQQIYAQLLA